jgi:hypothetical protein
MRTLKHVYLLLAVACAGGVAVGDVVDDAGDVAALASNDLVTVRGRLDLGHRVGDVSIPVVVLPAAGGHAEVALELRTIKADLRARDGEVVTLAGQYVVNWSVNPGGGFLLGVDGDAPVLLPEGG